MEKKEDDDAPQGDDRPRQSLVAASRIPNKGRGQDHKIAAAFQVNKSKLDLKIIKNMTIEE